MSSNGPLLSIVFVILFCMLLVWFVLVRILFKRLESSHPDKYADMGRPTLFLRNGPACVFAMLKFIVAREHTKLNDSYLTKLSDAMLAFSVVYIAIFFSLFFGVSTQVIAHAL